MKKYIFTLLIILICIILFVSVYLIKFSDNDIEPFYDYNDIKPRLKTGDIIFFTYRKFDSVINNVCYKIRTNTLNTIYGHVGIIYRNNNKIYIVESCNSDQCGYSYAKSLNNKKKGGIRIIDMDLYLNDYSEIYHGMFAVKFISKEIPSDIFLKSLHKYKDAIFPSSKDFSRIFLIAAIDLFVSNNMALSMTNNLKNDTIICTEAVYQLLNDCGVLKKYSRKMIWPNFFTHNKFNSMLTNGYSFSNLHKFKFPKK